jgi:hypothetical protein
MKYLYFSGIMTLTLCASAMAQRPDIDDFTLAGDTYRTGDDCYRLTEETNYSSGSIWYKRAADFSAPFSVDLNLMLGCKDSEGADGMVFVMTSNRNRLGYRGEGIGFAGLSPSIGIEIDTWQNFHLDDPAEDHVAILVNGQVHHRYSLAGPVKIPNIEDCRRHRFRVRWDPGAQRLEVLIDNKEIIALTYDLINKVFQGVTTIHWGVTAATGRFNNRHEVCFDKLAFTPALENVPYDPIMTRKLLAGDIVPLQGIEYPSGGSELSATSFAELDRLVNLMKKHPKFSVEIFGHTDNLGGARANRELSFRRAEAVANYLIRKGVAKERVIFNGFGDQYPLASNASAAGRTKNRRVEVHLFVPIP